MIELDFQPFDKEPRILMAHFSFGGFNYIVACTPTGVVATMFTPHIMLYDDDGDGQIKHTNLIAMKVGGEGDPLEARCWLYEQMGLE